MNDYVIPSFYTTTGISIAIIFTHPLEEKFSFFSLVAKVKEKFGYLDPQADPQPILPTAGASQNIPPEIPRYIFNSPNNLFNFTFSAQRFDFNFAPDESMRENLNHYTDKINSIMEDLNIVNPFRLGIVFNGNIVIDNLNDFKNRMISEKINEYDEIEISIRNTSTEKGIKVNQWKRYNLMNEEISYLFDLNTDLSTPIYNVKEGYDLYLSNKLGGLFDEYN